PRSLAVESSHRSSDARSPRHLVRSPSRAHTDRRTLAPRPTPFARPRELTPIVGRSLTAPPRSLAVESSHRSSDARSPRHLVRSPSRAHTDRRTLAHRATSFARRRELTPIVGRSLPAPPRSLALESSHRSSDARSPRHLVRSPSRAHTDRRTLAHRATSFARRRELTPIVGRS